MTGHPKTDRMRFLAAVLAVCLAGVGRAEVEEFKPTPAQLADYYAVYTNGDVKHLRSAFDTPRSSSPSETATAGKKDGETQLLRGFESYLTHKFIVLSRDPVIAGGSQVTIFFQGKSDAVFHAWVYDRGGGANRYELRGFKKANVPKDERDRMAVRYRRFLDDPEHAM